MNIIEFWIYACKAMPFIPWVTAAFAAGMAVDLLTAKYILEKTEGRYEK